MRQLKLKTFEIEKPEYQDRIICNSCGLDHVFNICPRCGMNRFDSMSQEKRAPIYMYSYGVII